MQISDTLKNVLCTNLCCTEDDLQKILDSTESKKLAFQEKRGCSNVMNFITFILLAILQMMLVSQSPSILWIIFCIIIQPILTFLVKQQVKSIGHFIKTVCRNDPVLYDISSKYIYFLVFAIICTIIRIILHMV